MLLPGAVPDNVRVDDIAEAAGVSPRTYNNYFASREQAIVAAVVAERDARVAEAVSARPTGVRLAEAVVDAVVEQYTDPTSHDPRVLLLLTNCPALREAYLHAAGQIEDPLAAVIADRIGSRDPYTSQVLSASVAVAIRVALHRWLLSEDTSVSGHGLVVPSGSLPELLRISLGVVTPELDAAEKRSP